MNTNRSTPFALILLALAAYLSALAQPGDASSKRALYREVAFQELTRRPIGAPVSSGPVIGLREDQVRAKAKYTGKSREMTKPDTRLLDAWTLSKRFTKPGEKSRWFEFEFTDGTKSAWLPAFALLAPAFMGAKAGDEFELFVHRFDAPMAGPELAGSEAVVMDAIRGRPGSVAAAQRPVFHEGGLFFSYLGARLGIGVKPGGASAVTVGANPEEATAFVLDLENPGHSSARIEVAGLSGPGTYAPKALSIKLPSGGSAGGGQNIVEVSGCRVKVARANPWEISGTLECPPGEHSPSRAEFSVKAR